MFRNIENFIGKQRAPRPSVGECVNTGQWPNSNMIDDCRKCVSEPGYYGEKQFYCGGKCMSEYNTSQTCSTKSLVAKVEEQCARPCQQKGSPNIRGCSDKFDCAKGMICDGGQCKPDPKPNTEAFGDYDYALNMNSAKGNFDKMYIGVL
jgi:hypothetical protein